MNSNTSRDKLQSMASSALLFNTYVNTVSTICELDKDILSKNFAMLNSNTWGGDERLVSLSMSLYISEHFNAMLVGVVFDFDGARDVFGQAIDNEMKIDTADSYMRTNERKREKAANPEALDKTHTIEMGISNYNPQILAAFMDNLSKSHAKFGPDFGEIFAEKVRALTEEDKMILSFIFSNVMYLLRAFSNNGLFINEVMDVVARVEAQYCK